jgi:hypothetical protein
VVGEPGAPSRPGKSVEAAAGRPSGGVAARRASPEARQQMIAGMVDGTQAAQANGNDVEGWQKLLPYAVLGDLDKGAALAGARHIAGKRQIGSRRDRALAATWDWALTESSAGTLIAGGVSCSALPRYWSVRAGDAVTYFPPATAVGLVDRPAVRLGLVAEGSLKRGGGKSGSP